MKGTMLNHIISHMLVRSLPMMIFQWQQHFESKYLGSWVETHLHRFVYYEHKTTKGRHSCSKERKMWNATVSTKIKEQTMTWWLNFFVKVDWSKKKFVFMANWQGGRENVSRINQYAATFKIFGKYIMCGEGISVLN